MKRLIATTILVLAVLAEVEPVCGQTRLQAEGPVIHTFGAGYYLNF